MIFVSNINLSQNELQNAVIQPLATAPATPKLGQIYCNSVTKRIQMYDGEKWKVIGAVIEDSDTNGNIKIDGVEMEVYKLPIATPSILGGVKVGTGISVTEDGTISTPQSDWSESSTDSAAFILNKPTKLSEFTNDEEFIDSTVDNLANYYKKSDVYTKTEITEIVAGLALIDISVVESLPESGSKNIIYLLPKEEAQTSNAYEEYVWTGTKYEKIGDTEVDLTDYLTKTGDASKTTVTFSTAATRENIATGEALDVIASKIAKYFGDLKSVAFSGSYTDLGDKPTLVKVQEVKMTEGTQKEVTVVGEKILSVALTDSVTHEVLTADVNITGLKVTVKIAEAYSNGIDILIAYM